VSGVIRPARPPPLLTLARSQISLEPGTTSLDALRELPGIGEWTAQYLAMRALGWPDAFPAADLGVLKALRAKNAKEATLAAEPLRPWRAYAVIHLWTQLGAKT
jgi:AraC family transcriptional regulator of adaptative response / DNA-3-methyladenine glycosylase II